MIDVTGLSKKEKVEKMLELCTIGSMDNHLYEFLDKISDSVFYLITDVKMIYIDNYNSSLSKTEVDNLDVYYQRFSDGYKDCGIVFGGISTKKQSNKKNYIVKSIVSEFSWIKRDDKINNLLL